MTAPSTWERGSETDRAAPDRQEVLSGDVYKRQVVVLSHFGDNGGIDGMGMVETYPQADGGAGVRVRNTGIMQKWVSKTCKPVNSMVL